MTLQEIYERVLVDAGQFVAGPALVELDIQKFKLLVDRVLERYSRYFPIENRNTITVQNQLYTYVSPNIPDWISECVPITVLGIPYPPFVQEYSIEDNITRSFVWKYNKPNLYVQIAGIVSVLEIYHHKLVTASPDTYECTTITEKDDLFFQHVLARFLVGIGRNRRAFTVSDFPLSTDAGQLVSEGLQLEKDVIQDYGTYGKWYLSYS